MTRGAGNLELLGVYQLTVTEELVAAQARALCGDAPSSSQLAQVRQELASTVLVEVLVSNADARFDVSDFAQEDRRLPRGDWQEAWAEAYLSAGGERLLVERGEPLPPTQEAFRLAFFIHEWQVGQPLRTSYGKLPGLPPQPMPERLAALVPYELAG